MCMPAVSIALFGGVLIACAGAIAASPLYPLGVARRADPDVGLHGDLTVLAVGAAALVITVTAIAFGAAIHATRPMVRMQAGERRSSRPKPAVRSRASVCRHPCRAVCGSRWMPGAAGHDCPCARRSRVRYWR